MPFTILCTADLHLGRRSTDIGDRDDSISTSSTWRKMVDYVIANGIDAMVLAGDIVDEDNRYYEAVGPLQEGFSKLEEHNIPAYLVAGNHDHDVLHQLIRVNAYKNIHLLGRDGTWENVSHPYHPIQFTGWSFNQRHIRFDPLQEFDPAILDPDKLSIGILHGDVDVQDSPYGQISLAKLSHLPLQAWIFGHIHKPEILSEKNPLVAYTGSPHALNPSEQGGHGALEIRSNEAGVMESRLVLFSPVRYESIKLEINEDATEDKVRRLVTETIPARAEALREALDGIHSLVFDLLIIGAHNQPDMVRAWVRDLPEDYDQLYGQTKISVRKVKTELQPSVSNLEALALEPSPAGKIAETILAISREESTPFLESLVEQWKERQNMVSSANTFLPIQNMQDDDTKTRRPEDYILKECRRLLGNLIAQQKNE